MSFKLDTRKFKKVSSDKHTTTLQHEDGHQIRIMHSALSPKIRGQLAELPSHELKMADGGKVADNGVPDTEKGPQHLLDNTSEGARADIAATFGTPKPKKSPKPQEYAEGGTVDPAKTPEQQTAAQAPVVINVGNGGSPQPTPSAPPQPAQDESMMHKIGNFMRGAISHSPPALAYQAAQAAAPTVAEQGAQLIGGLAGQPPQAPTMQPADPQAATAAPASLGPTAVTPGPEQQAQHLPPGLNDPYGVAAYGQNYTQGINEQKAGIQGQAIAEGQQGKAEAAALQKNTEMQQQVMQDYQHHTNELTSEYHNFIDDVKNQHIDPQHYVSSMGIGKRIATTIGVILGGFSAVSGQQNPALKLLNDNIQRDIEAQKGELGKRENLLSANMKQFGNLRDATQMTHAMQLGIVSNELKMAAAKAADPMAKSRALQAAGTLDQQAAPILSQIAMRRTVLGAPDGVIRPEQKIMAIVPKEEQKGATDELKAAQVMQSSFKNYMSAFDQLAKIQTAGNRIMNPLQSKSQINALKQPILAALSKETAGRFTEQDAQMLDHLFPDLTDNAETMAKKRAAGMKLISEKMHFPELDKWGIRMSAPSTTGIQESAPILPKK